MFFAPLEYLTILIRYAIVVRCSSRLKDVIKIHNNSEEAVMKKFVVCTCGNVLGCQVDGQGNMWCETTKTGDQNRSFGCSKEKFFACTLDKDVLVEQGQSEMIITLESSTCRHCPVESIVIPDEELGPVAMLSS